MFSSVESSALNNKFGRVWIDWFVANRLLLGANLVTFCELGWASPCLDKDTLSIGYRIVLRSAFDTPIGSVEIETFSSLSVIREVEILARES